MLEPTLASKQCSVFQASQKLLLGTINADILITASMEMFGLWQILSYIHTYYIYKAPILIQIFDLSPCYKLPPGAGWNTNKWNGRQIDKRKKKHLYF